MKSERSRGKASPANG